MMTITKKAVLVTVVMVCGLFFLSCNKPAVVENVESVPKDALYKDASAPVEQRVADLLGRMTIDEKVGQMTQVCRDVIAQNDIKQMLLGSVLSGGGSAPRDNSVKGWQSVIDMYQMEALSTRLGIPLLYGIDSVHGNNTLRNATIFPHNIGLGATGDADLVRRIGRAAALETLATGIPWTFAPCVAVLRDPRWGRSYESFGEFTAPVSKLGTAFVDGWQSATDSGVIPVACAKHYLGDGCTVYGSSAMSSAILDQGDMRETEKFVRETLLPPYQEAVKHGVRTVMPSFSSWNGLNMHANRYLLTDVLKGELGFTGFVVSDWQGIDHVDKDYYKAMVIGINAGIDMNMVPYEGKKFIDTVKMAVENGDITMARIDDAVSRILRVKFEMGLFEHPVVGTNLAQSVRCDEHLALAREAVAKSLVVLKNDDNVLPLKKSEPVVYVMGRGAHDIGTQCGGWTMTWQGKAGNTTKGTTIFEGLSKALPTSRVELLDTTSLEDADTSAVCVVVVSETPYAEFMGDSRSLSPNDTALVQQASKHFSRVVLVTVSGRPVIVSNEISVSQAAVAAWLPGSEGDGVADVLCGSVKPSGKLPVDWPHSVDQLPYGNFISGKETPLYPAGYGLTW